MADALDTIVSVTVTRETRTPSQRGFGIPLIVGYHTAWLSDRVREYADSTEMADDGFTAGATGAAHLLSMVDAMKAQNPSPSSIKIGRKANAVAQTVHLIPRIVTAGYKYSVAIDGITYEYTALGSEGLTGVVDALVAGISGATGLTVTDGVTWAVIAGAPGVIHGYVAKRGLDLYDASGASGLTADLAAIAAEDDISATGPAYGWLLDVNSEAQITAFDTFLESRIALGIVQSADWDVRDGGETGDIASGEKNEALTRTSGIYHSQIGTPIAAAWMGKELPKNPGQSNWAHKTLATIPADSLTTGEQSAVNAKNWSWYSRVGGQNITFEGKTPAGEYVDIMHAVDFSTARIKEALFGTLTANDKVPQTDSGIETFRSAIYSVLKLCSSEDFPIFDPTTIQVGLLTMSDVPTPDRVNRILRGLTYEARLQGAFNRVVVKGRVYV